MDAPKSTELEVHLFGPGYGECAVIHVGNNEWIVVDSCIAPKTKEPAALRYFEAIGVNAKEAVKLIVATHWHDDHIRGLAKVLRACEAAEFACPAALQRREFFELIGCYFGPAMMATTGIDELKEIYVEMERRGDGHGLSPLYAIENRKIWERRLGPSVRAIALSPSDVSFEKAVAHFASQLPVANATKPRVRSQNPNHAALALRIEVANDSILLGSDLEVVASPVDGWNRVVAVFSNDNPSKVFKVAHHGSSNAHHDGVWQHMVAKGAIAIMTPFLHGRVVLPKPEDVVRLTTHTAHAFITCPPKHLDVKLRDKVASEIMSNVITSPLRSGLPPYGSIRLRHNLSEPTNEWEIVPFGPALNLTAVVAKQAVA